MTSQEDVVTQDLWDSVIHSPLDLWANISEDDARTVREMLHTKPMRKALMAVASVCEQLERSPLDLRSPDAIHDSIKQQGLIVGMKQALDVIFAVAVGETIQPSEVQ